MTSTFAIEAIFSLKTNLLAWNQLFASRSSVVIDFPKSGFGENQLINDLDLVSAVLAGQLQFDHGVTGLTLFFSSIHTNKVIISFREYDVSFALSIIWDISNPLFLCFLLTNEIRKIEPGELPKEF